MDSDEKVAASSWPLKIEFWTKLGKRNYQMKRGSSSFDVLRKVVKD